MSENQERLLVHGGHDDGHATTFVEQHGRDVLHVPALGWMFWTGSHWEVGAEHLVHNLVVKLLVARRTAAAANSARDKNMEILIRESRPDYSRVRNTMAMLKPKVHADVSEFDVDPNLLNVKNGVLDLRTGELTGHDRGQRFTYCLDTPYDPLATCPEWEKFLLESVITPEMVDFLRVAAGYSLTGHTREECLFYCHGEPRSGKGTFAETLLEILGEPLATQVEFNTFTGKRGADNQNFDLAGLKATRFVVAGEPDAYEKLNASKVKSITGGDSVRCAHKHRDFFRYRPAYKIWLFSNFPPRGDVDDEALWYRVKTIKFPVSKMGHEDKELKGRFLEPENRMGILAWAVSGAMTWFEKGGGLVTPGAVVEATAEARLEQDTVAQWLEERTVTKPGGKTPTTVLYTNYKLWCANQDEEARGVRGFGRALSSRGFKPYRTMHERGWEGIELPEVAF